MNKANADFSFIFGKYLRSNAGGTVTIGIGTSDYLINGIPYSLMVGFYSNVPTLFVGPSGGTGKTGNVGIGNVTSPTAKLHIRADVDEAAELKLEHRTTGSNQIARIYLGSHKIEASSNSHMNFYTTNSSQHYNFYNGTIRSEQGTAATPAYSFTGSPNTGMFRPEANNIAFST